MMQSAVIALMLTLWTLTLIGLGAEPTPWLSMRSGRNWHELTWRGRTRRIRYLSAQGNGSRYRSIEILSI